MKDRLEYPDFGEINVALTPVGWRLLCGWDQCPSPHHWAVSDGEQFEWSVTAFYTIEPASQQIRCGLLSDIAPRQRAPSWLGSREVTFSAALARHLAERMNEQLLRSLTNAIEATADLLWREFGPGQQTEYSAIGMIFGPQAELWGFGLMIRTDHHGRIELGIATTEDEMLILGGDEPMEPQPALESVH